MGMNRGKKITNQVRIIGGEHRGRRLSFPDLPGLRPTGDRVRETLFNWLQPRLPGSTCLDLFAGSGALGLEAASRGAGRVVMVERAPAAVAQLRENVALLGSPNVRVIQAEALTWLQGESEPFEIVFLDPPFSEGFLAECCGLLQQNGWLQPDARIYIETDAGNGLPQLPSEWRILKQKRAGQVAFSLVTNGVDEGKP